MRIVSFVAVDGSPRLGVERGDRIVELSAAAPELPADLLGLLRLGAAGIQRAREAAASATSTLPRSEVKLLAPLPDPGKIICLGVNFRSHLAQSGLPESSEPLIFSKFSSSIIGPGEVIRLPAAAPKRVDYEAELAVVIGKRGRDIPESEAMDHVAGYMVANDLSAREWQLKKPGGQWLLGKTFDTFMPLGPALVTADEVPDPHKLRVTCTVSGELLQDASTEEMIFSIPFIIAYMSRVCTLEPGDVISTGTPGGVGMHRTPQRFLRAGDLVETAVEGVGVLVNPVEGPPQADQPAADAPRS